MSSAQGIGAAGAWGWTRTALIAGMSEPRGITTAITTHVEITITDWRALGRYVAKVDDPGLQAHFLAGLAEAMDDAVVPIIAHDVVKYSNAADTIADLLGHLKALIE